MATTAIAMSAIAAASPVVSEDVPVPGGLAALAQALGIAPLDRARSVAELARLVYADPIVTRQRPDSTFRRMVAYFAGAGQVSPSRQAPVDVDRVPMPLPASVWSQAVFRRPVTSANLFAAVLSDSAAAQMAYGLAALDDETLQFLAAHPAVLTRLYERDATVFGAFAAHLQIHGDRVVPPGGDRAVPLWEALLNQKAAHPEAFVRELFSRDEGRIAYLYDVIGHLDSPRAAFALGLWIDEAGVRAARIKSLALDASSSFKEWDVTQFPFTRPAHDYLSLFARVQAGPDGAPGFPAGQSVWMRALARGDIPEGPIRGPGNREEPPLIDAAWIAEATLSGNLTERGDRLDQFAFGQRVFAGAGAAELSDLQLAIQAFPRLRMLMLTLERIGVRRPALYAQLARHAQRASSLDPVRGRATLAQFQGALALIARMTRVKTVDRPTAERLLTTLAGVPLDRDRGYLGAFAPFLQFHLGPAVAGDADEGAEERDGGLEEGLLDALAGARDQIPARPISWEGQPYQFDVVASEAARLRRARERQGGPSIDAALDLYRVAQTLATGAAGLADIHEAIARLTALGAEPLLKRPADAAIEKLAAIRNSRDPVRAAQMAQPVLEMVDMALGEALLSLSYAVDWGDPQGAARLARHVARRHNFGFTKITADARVRTAWALPRQMFLRGEPWHVEGAVLGLDIALAPLALRRITAEPPGIPPVISSIERDTFVASLGMMNPFLLRDTARDAIADAIARGRQRVERLDKDGGDLAAVVREIAMDGWRARAVRWTLAHDRARLGSWFSMTELLHLGGGRDLELDPWGISAMTTLGCICSVIPAPGFNTALVGRPQIGVMATTVADLHLRVAVVLRELDLPAALAKAVLAAALQDYLEEVSPSSGDDWLTLVRTAQAVSRERVEDYVAGATASGPFMPPESTPPLPRP